MRFLEVLGRMMEVVEGGFGEAGVILNGLEKIWAVFGYF